VPQEKGKPQGEEQGGSPSSTSPDPHGPSPPQLGPDGLPYELQILQSLRRIVRAIDLYSQKLKNEYDLTVPQLVCLLAVAENTPLTATRLAQSVHLSPSTVVGILDRLERRGLIQRERNPQDRRRVNITATIQGLELARTAPTPLQDGLANALRRLPELEQAAIALSLGRIVEMMEARDLEASHVLESGALREDAAAPDNVNSASRGNLDEPPGRNPID